MSGDLIPAYREGVSAAVIAALDRVSQDLATQAEATRALAGQVNALAGQVDQLQRNVNASTMGLGSRAVDAENRVATLERRQNATDPQLAELRQAVALQGAAIAELGERVQALETGELRMLREQAQADMALRRAEARMRPWLLVLLGLIVVSVLTLAGAEVWAALR